MGLLSVLPGAFGCVGAYSYAIVWVILKSAVTFLGGGSAEMLHPPGIFVGISPVETTYGDAVVNYRLQDGQKNNAPEGEKFSTRENKQAVAEMETVVSVPGYNGSLKASDVIQTVSEFFLASEMPLKMKNLEVLFCGSEE